MVSSNLLDALVPFDNMSDDVSLITIQANHDLNKTRDRWTLYSYNIGIIEPNTDYNCIRIYDNLLFIVEKNSIQEYKSVVTDSVPVKGEIKIEDKNIINFLHWVLSYDYNLFQYVFPYMQVFLKEAYYIESGRMSSDYKEDFVCNYLIELLNESRLPYGYNEDTVFIGDSIFKNSNLKEEYHKCLLVTDDKKALLQKIHSTTKAALMSIKSELYLKNIAKRFLYNKSADMLYKDI